MATLPALRDHINRIQQISGTPEIIFQHCDLPKKIDEKTSLQVFRIIQEALNNALKHADAKEILIQIYGQDNQLAILIEDDGKGFIVDMVKKGNGLENLRIRTALLNGELNIDGTADGTVIFALVPIKLMV